MMSKNEWASLRQPAGCILCLFASKTVLNHAVVMGYKAYLPKNTDLLCKFNYLPMQTRRWPENR